MARRAEFRVVVATDGSRGARAAVDAATRFPWPAGASVHGVVAGRPASTDESRRRSALAVGGNATRVAAEARRALARRWPDADVRVIDLAPVEAVLLEARRLGASAIVMGWRGHGLLRRLLMGSVSRDVVRQARCPVLVVRRRTDELRAFVLGVDGSTMARRAARFLARLRPPRGQRVTVVRVEEPAAMPATAGRLPARVQGVLRREVAALNAERLARARREVDAAAALLSRAGWSVRKAVRSGEPLPELLATVAATRAHALVVGARGISGISRLLLGSVADGALNRSPVPVLVVR